MFSLRATLFALIALLPAMPLATGALAHTIGDDDGTASAALIAAPWDAGETGERVGLLPAETFAAGQSEWSVASPPNPVTAPAAAGVEPFDALSTALQPPGKAQTQQAGVRSSPATATSFPGGVPLAGEEIVAAISDLQQSLVRVIGEAVDAQRDAQGGVSFSLAGMEGFYYAERDGQVSLGHGDVSLAIVGDHGGTSGQPRAVAGATQHSPALENVNVLQQISRLIWEIVSYPLTWVVIIMLLIGKIALLLAQRRARRRRRSKRSARSEPVKVVRTRKRIRFRIKRHTSPVGLQKP